MFTYSKKIYWFLVFCFISFLPGGLAYGGGVSPSDTSVIPNPLGPKTNTISAFIMLLLNTLFPIATLVAVFFMIYAGFRMVIYASNEEKLAEARQAFLWTVIGIAILLGAKVLSAVICGTINQLGTMQLSCEVKP